MSSRQKLSEMIQSELEKDILSGKYHEGDYLPSEAALCQIYAVSRTTIREAVSGLAEKQFVQRQHGKGVQVINRSDLVVADSLRNMVIRGSYTVDEFFETRRALDLEIAYFATTRASAAQIQSAGQAVEEMRRSGSDLEHYIQADIRFHETVAQATQNHLMIALYAAILPMLQEMVRKVVHSTGMVEHDYQYHAKILDGIRNRDPEMTRSQMLAHDRASEKMFHNSLEGATCVGQVLIGEYTDDEKDDERRKEDAG